MSISFRRLTAILLWMLTASTGVPSLVSGQQPLIPSSEALQRRTYPPVNSSPQVGSTHTSPHPIGESPASTTSRAKSSLDWETRRMLLEQMAAAGSIEELKWWQRLEATASPQEIRRYLAQARSRSSLPQPGLATQVEPLRDSMEPLRQVVTHPEFANDQEGEGQGHGITQTDARRVSPPSAPPYRSQVGESVPSQQQPDPSPLSTTPPLPRPRPEPYRQTVDRPSVDRRDPIPRNAGELPVEQPAPYRSFMNPVLQPLRSVMSDESGRPESPNSEMSATDSPATTRLESPYLQDELRRLVTLLETELAGSRGTVTGVSESQRQQHVRLRMLYLLAGQTDRALDVIPGLPRAEQEFWQNYFWAMSNELDSRSTADRPAQAARTAALIEVSQRHLRELTNLEVRDICFCQRINSFGNYERFLRDEFPPGQPILVYAELKNFHSELCLDGMYRTRLRTTIEIVPVEDGVSLEPVDRRDFPATEDVCRSMRNDYFNSYRIDIPANLAAGRYLLRVLVLDEVGNKRATEEVPFFVR